MRMFHFQSYFYYIQYQADTDYAPLSQIFRSPEDVSATEAVLCEKIFGALCVGLYPPVRSGEWKIIGRAPVDMIREPMLYTLGPDGEEGQYLWTVRFPDGRSKKYGASLPHEFQHLELTSVWSYQDLEDRIKTGYCLWCYQTMRERAKELYELRRQDRWCRNYR